MTFSLFDFFFWTHRSCSTVISKCLFFTPPQLNQLLGSLKTAQARCSSITRQFVSLNGPMTCLTIYVTASSVVKPSTTGAHQTLQKIPGNWAAMEKRCYWANAAGQRPDVKRSLWPVKVSLAHSKSYSSNLNVGI